jgi:hypothetical protein
MMLAWALMLSHLTLLGPPPGSTPRLNRNPVEVGGRVSGFDTLAWCISGLVSCTVVLLTAKPELYGNRHVFWKL